MVYALIDHRNDAKNVQNSAVKPLASGSWFHLSFEHFDVFSIVDRNVVVYLLINANDLINKNAQSSISRSGTIIGHFRVPKPLTFKTRSSAQPFLRK